MFISTSNKSGVSKGTLIGAIVGGIAAATILSVVVSLLILRTRTKRSRDAALKRRRCEYNPTILEHL